MKPSEQCKSHGVTLKKVSQYTEQSEQTLINWHKNKPWLFHAVIVGVAKIKETAV